MVSVFYAPPPPQLGEGEGGGQYSPFVGVLKGTIINLYCSEIRLKYLPFVGWEVGE
jgi:hypothetical protein